MARYGISLASYMRACNVYSNWRYAKKDRKEAAQIIENYDEGASFDRKQKPWYPKSKPRKGDFSFEALAKEEKWAAEDQVYRLLDFIENTHCYDELFKAMETYFLE